MIDELRFVRVDNKLVLQAYDGHVWYTPQIIDSRDLPVQEQCALMVDANNLPDAGAVTDG